MENMAWNGPKWNQEDFSLLIQTLPTFWAERIWNLRISAFFILWIQILSFWISRSPDFPNLAWAEPGLDFGGGGEMLASPSIACFYKPFLGSERSVTKCGTRFLKHASYEAT